LNELTRRGSVCKMGNGGRGGHKWALINKIQAEGSTKPTETRVEESLHTAVPLGEGESVEEKGKSEELDVGKDVISGNGNVICASEPKKQNRRPFGLTGYLKDDHTDPGNVQMLVAFGISRGKKDKNGKKRYTIRHHLLLGTEFQVAVVESKPVTRSYVGCKGETEAVTVGHIIKGLVRVTADELNGLQLRPKEVLGDGWVPVKFYLPNGRGGPVLDGKGHVLVRVSCQLACFNSKFDEKWDRVAVGDLTVDSEPITDDQVEEIIDDLRAKAAEQAAIAKRVRLARERHCLA